MSESVPHNVLSRPPTATKTPYYVATETTSLLSSPAEGEDDVLSTQGDDESTETHPETTSVWGILSVLLIGVFISQADTSLVLATYAPIASEFDDFENASWLLSSYMLAMCITQPLYGKLSDIFGRKAMLQTSYGLFALGSLLCGFAQSMPQLIAARVLQGTGGAGMVCLVSILITDIAPMREVASYRSYVNVVQTVGRSSGGVIGGLLAEKVGWRVALSGQAPLTVLGMILVAWKLALPSQQDPKLDGVGGSLAAKIKRTDILGSFLLSFTLLPLLLILDAGGDKMDWLSVAVLVLLSISLFSGIAFSFVETRWAAEPIFPLYLLANPAVLGSYLSLTLQNASQTAVMFITPLYFQVAKGASVAESGSFMIPAIAGNTIGGLITGMLIQKFGRTKWLLIASAVSSGLCFTLLVCFWHGTSSNWQSLMIFPGGLATAVAHSVLFVVVASSVDDKDIAIAGSGMYLSGSIGGVAGICLASAVFQAHLKSSLRRQLEELHIPNVAEVIKKAMADVAYIRTLPQMLRDIVVGSYIDGFQASFVLGLGLAGGCLILSILSPERRLV